jgi:hypothetical protein
VAPIALYPDPLLGQVLVASTYPLEIVQLQQWLAKNPGLKDKALADAVAKQPWDPSIQSMAALPDAVKRLGDDIKWTDELGNAFLAQQSDVMDAVQRMRKKAEGTGALKSNEQQKVETKVVEQKTVIVVEPANPEVVYVPSCSPVVVYGPPVYAYALITSAGAAAQEKPVSSPAAAQKTFATAREAADALVSAAESFDRPALKAILGPHGDYLVAPGEPAQDEATAMDFVVKGVMIGGFALVAAPAEYLQTGVKTFIVSHDGVVYEKDLGAETLSAAKAMERFNPDKTWTRVIDE